jgi:hypothetical protein
MQKVYMAIKNNTQLLLALLVFMLTTVCACFGQTQLSTIVVTDSKSAKITALLNHELGKFPIVITQVMKESITKCPGFTNSEVKYRYEDYKPNEGDTKFYIKFTFEEPERSKDAILIHLSLYDKNKRIFVPMNSYYQDWDNEVDFSTSFANLVGSELGENLQYFTTKRLTQAKKTLYINPKINTALCPIPEKSVYSNFLYKFPLDMFSTLRKFNSSQYLYCLDYSKQCFEISMESASTNTLNPGPSKVKFNMRNATESVDPLTLEELYKMWSNQKAKNFQDLCTNIFKQLSSSKGCN